MGRQAIRPAESEGLRRRRDLFPRRGRTRFSTTSGFFDTGDVATVDPSGVIQITDRAKDVIKSGGEWISSTIDVENLADGDVRALLRPL